MVIAHLHNKIQQLENQMALVKKEWEMSDRKLNQSDLAAWSIVASLMLSLDEVVTKN